MIVFISFDLNHEKRLLFVHTFAINLQVEQKLLRKHAWKVKISHLIDGGDDLMTVAVYFMVWQRFINVKMGPCSYWSENSLYVTPGAMHVVSANN